jgi:tetratricopeptide (TPR) repeat protein
VSGEHVPPAPNRLLDAIVKKCFPNAANAAARRLEGNEHFKKKEWQNALDAYASALQLDETSSAACANRSIAQLKLDCFAEAIDDATRAVALRPLWSKWHLRLAAALRANCQHSEALVPLIRAVALEHAEADSLRVGSQVRIHGLHKSAKFNGAQGKCIRFHGDRSRWEVRLQGGRMINVECGNLHDLGKVVDPKVRDEILKLLEDGHRMPSIESLTFPSPATPRQILVEQIQTLREEFDCCLCSALICEPTTLPCGHCMCRDCLARLLDHALQSTPSCPLCRQDLMPLLRQSNLRARDQQRTGLRFSHGAAQLTVCSELARLFARWYPEEYAKRLEEIRSPEGEWVPIFVCSLSAPFIPTPLHIFEPRYRLMMRRAVESNQRFGMCLPTEDGFADTGTMLFIDRFEQLSDGRSFVGTKGVARFSVIERGTLDGYSTALIKPFEEDARGFPASINFHCQAVALQRGARTLLSTVPPQMIASIDNQLGPLPDTDSPDFAAHMSFYVALLLNSFKCDDAIAADLVFKQPEEQRWQLLLQTCSQIKPFREALQADAHTFAELVAESPNAFDEDHDEKIDG